MLQFEPFLSLLLALFAGLLIGLERQQNAASDTTGPEILGGARTHPLVAIVGACTMLLARQAGPGGVSEILCVGDFHGFASDGSNMRLIKVLGVKDCKVVQGVGPS